MPVFQPSARTFFPAFHHGHGVFPHPSGATVATVRSMSLRSSLLRALCIPWQTPLVGPLGSGERTTLGQHATDNFHLQKKHLRRHDEKKKKEPLKVLVSQPSGIHRCKERI